ncbi:hypothetical protein D2V17_18635 [Aurantiacibacter xanthus]|uniref:Elongation factor P n=1 Tax=Aurantiacibacter xanthus TaxID=1784712 RepID=A0A3A1P100_9SPHN|nr:hypothetical protein [Aurantiacibacter xanthus]RIV80917.1 hypothetical protein D2V17_18635 [Aurantiacibacter xanthus]
MKPLRYTLRCALAGALLGGIAVPAFAHEPVLKCVLLDADTVRCRGGYAEGEAAPGGTIEVIAYSGQTVFSGKLDKGSILTFQRPATGYYVLFNEGPGSQAIVEHDEIGPPRANDRARWMRSRR